MRVVHNRNKSPARSLATQSRRQMILLGTIVFIGLMILIIIFSFYQIDKAVDNYTRLEAVKLEKLISDHPDIPLPNNEELQVYRSWDDIPSDFQRLFEKNKKLTGKVLEAQRINHKGDREYVYLTYSNTLIKSGIYMLDIEDAETIDQLAKTIFEKTIIEAGFIISIFMLFFFLAIAFIFRSALQPINLLVDWSNKVKEQPDKHATANFSIKELNDIAGHLLSNLQKVKDYNVREQQFLQHASHELRTPLAIIQASLDTLEIRTPKDHPSYPSLKRANRASHNMIRLSEALLWISRQSNREIEKVQINPAEVCQELITEMQYLTLGKDIEIKTHCHCMHINIEADLFRIILANLIRNGFQHSSCGTISITINEQGLIMTNPVEKGTIPATQCFGLGLQLVERIALKLGWLFHFNLESNRATVSLKW